MIGTLALALCLVSGKTSSPAQFAIDLFLVAGNQRQIQGADWILEPKTPVEMALKPILDGYSKKKKQFIILDGGDCLSAPKVADAKPGMFTQRTYNGFDSQTEGVTRGSESESYVVAHTDSELTLSGTVYIRPYTHSGSISQGRLDFKLENASMISIPVQDLNSYIAVRDRGVADEKQDLANSLIVSGDSIDVTEGVLQSNSTKFSGICVCATGTPSPSDPNIVSFPAPGVVSHYVLSRQKGIWSLKFVELLNMPGMAVSK